MVIQRISRFQIAVRMDHLLSVPDALGHRILSDFLTLKDVMALDRAYASHGLREQYLGVVRGSYEYDAVVLTGHYYYHYFCCWLAKRMIFMTSMTITLELFYSRLPSYVDVYLRECFAALAHLRITLGKVNQQHAPYLLTLLSGSVNLRSLTLPNGLCCDASLLRDISAWCPQLNSLKLQTTQFSSSSSHAMANMRFLMLGRLHLGNGIFPHALIAATPNLEHLTLDAILDGTVRYSAGEWTKLKSICIVGDCANDSFLVPLISRNPTLESVQIRSMDMYTDEHMEVTNSTLHCIANHCLGLTELRLQCNGVTHLGVSDVVLKCTKLTRLSLQYTGQISNATLFAVTEHGHNLTHLDIELCTVNPSALLRVANGCESLQEIRFTTRNVFKMHKQHQIDFKTMMNAFRDKNVAVIAI